MNTSENLPSVPLASHKSKGPSTSQKTGYISPQEAVKFDWENKWLKGEEYAHILTNLDLYCKAFNLVKLSAKTHPPSIYTEPQNGMIYFVEGNSVGSDFGFPRVDTKKHYRWKKMNFTTDLPKKRPYVTYIVASAVKCERFFPNSKDEGPSYRMHAVILNKDRVHTQKYKSKLSTQPSHETDDHNQCQSSTCSSADSVELEKGDGVGDETHEIKPTPVQKEKNYILCHIRKIDSNYKVSRAPGKRESLKDDEEGEEQNDAEDEDEEEGCEETIVKKLFCSKETTPIVKEKTSPTQEKEEPHKLQPLRILSGEVLRQITSKSEASSPLQILRPKPTISSPVVMKSSLSGIGSKNSAFNSFHTACITPKFTALQEKPKVESQVVEEKSIQIPVVKNKSGQKQLFEAFNLIETTNLDYLKLFSSLIHTNKK